MTSGDPSYDFAVDVVRRLREQGFEAFWAGGCVRDLLMGRRPEDYDVATNARPQQVRDLFGRRRTLAVGESFGVIIVLGPKHQGETLQVEVATFRTEGDYLDGRRPESVQFATAEEDAWRRDFTINGMFYDPLRECPIDYVGGAADIEQGVVRAIGEPHDRMREDKLRMLRAARFAAVLDFELDPATAQAVRDMAAEIHVVSPERIAQELRKMLAGRHRRRAVRLMQQTGLLVEVFPELAPLLVPDEPREWSHTLDMLDRLGDAGFEVALAALLHTVPCPENESRRQSAERGTVRAICRRLRLSNRETDHVVWLVRHQRALDDAPSQSKAQLKRLLAHPLRDDLLKLAKADAAAANRDAPEMEFVEDFLRRHTPSELDPPPLVTGQDLIELGASPGPEFQRLLETVRDAQLNEAISTSAEAGELLRRLLQDSGS